MSIYKEIPKPFRKKDTKGIYIPVYIQYWIEYKSKKKGKSNGEILAELIMSQPTFKKDMREFFDESKP